MTYTYKKELFAILIALSVIIILFLTNSAYAKSTVKSNVTINGVEYINDEVTSDNSTKSDIDVSIKNNEGTIKYNVNGEEKIIQISPKSDVLGNNNSEEKTEERDVDQDDQKKADKDAQEKRADENETKIKTENKKTGDIIEQVMQMMDNFFAKLSDLFNN